MPWRGAERTSSLFALPVNLATITRMAASNEAKSAWARLALKNAPEGRTSHTAVVIDNLMLVFGER